MAVRVSRKDNVRGALCERGIARLFFPENGILRGFRDSELHDTLGRNLDGVARLGIAPHSGLPILENQHAQARQLKPVLTFLVGQRRQVIEDLRRSFFRQVRFFREVLRNAVPSSSILPCRHSSQ
jgi:hypothetical protein